MTTLNTEELLELEKGGMKKLKLLKQNQIAVREEESIYCDFCGDVNKTVYTSSYSDHSDESKNESQICKDCVTQLSKLL